MGVYIYTNYTQLDFKDILMDNDAYFNENILACNFGGTELQVMEDIDKAVLLDKNSGTIKTPRGITAIENLSTGCKTILNYLSLIKEKDCDMKAINVTQCGWNALEELFAMEEVKCSGMGFVLLHRDSLHYCKERDYIINKSRHIRSLLFI